MSIHPNPSGARATIEYELPAAGRVSIAIFDLQGRKVVTLVERMESEGRHGVVWQGRDRSGQAARSGIYWVRFEAGGAVRSRRFVRL